MRFFRSFFVAALLFLVLAVFFTATLAANYVFAQISVKGYYRKDGTYVKPYTRSAPKSGNGATRDPNHPEKTVSVSGYYRKNGTYVSAYKRRPPGGGSDRDNKANGSYGGTAVSLSKPTGPAAPAVSAENDLLPLGEYEESYKSQTDTPFSTPAKPKRFIFRKWQTADGKYSTEAQFVSEKEGIVTIRKRDGETKDVPLKRLSNLDKRYVTNALLSAP